MAGRFPRPLNPLKAVWDRETADNLYEFLQSLFKGMSGLQKTPDDPSTIQAGDVSDEGTDQAPARSDHIHGVDTAAPSVPIALAGPATEGSTTALMRAGAGNYLGQGGAVNNDTLVSDGTNWVPRPIGFSESIIGHRVFAARPAHIPGPDDSQVVLAGRIFGRR